MIKEFNDNLKDLEAEREILERRYFKITGNGYLVTTKNSMKPLCNKWFLDVCNDWGISYGMAKLWLDV